MIRIQRPAAVPAVLVKRGVPATTAFCIAYDTNPAGHTAGAATFTFDSGIYGAGEVKDTLRSAQHDKCCFCESKISHISYGDVEHFRPKAATRQVRGGPLTRPGYYWLAYEWTNLFFCCQLCNQRHKENLFPLWRVRRRARSHHDFLLDEEPLFVNPEEDPSRHLRFRQEYLYPVRNSRRGRITIDSLGLNRPALAERRKEHLVLVQHLLDCRGLLVQAVQRAQAKGQPAPTGFTSQMAAIESHLARMALDSAEYAAMTRAAIA